MKKFLLSAAMLLLGAVATFAQDIPDGSSWKEGDEITSQLSWSNLSFEDGMTNWTSTVSGTTKSEDNSGTFTGAFEAYNQEEVDLYQYVWLPAGMYKMTCQGYYRGGGSGGVDADTYIGSTPVENDCAYNFANTWVDNAFITATRGTLNGTVFTTDHVFKSPLMPRLYEKVTEQIWRDPVVSGMDGYAGWVRSDYYYEDLGCWGPTSFPGSCSWFAVGKYQPIEGVKYNTVTFFLTEPGCVKVGITKNKKINNDTFFCTDFKMYFLGADIDEAADLMLAQDDLNDLYEQLENLQEKYDNGFIAIKLQEVLEGEIKDTYGYDPYDMDKETVNAAKAACQQLLSDVNGAIVDMESMNGAITSIEAMLATSDNPGKDALEAAVADAKKLVSDEYEYDENDDWDIFQNQITALNAARLAYLTSSEPDENGAWDFTGFINYPWFCNPEYEPSWDAENKAWIPNQAALDLGWSEKDDVNGTAADIANMVNLGTNTNVVGEWYRVNTGLEVYWNDNLTCVKKWDMPHTDDDVREVAQKVVGIPNGFYKLKALGQTWTNDWDQAEKLCKCRIYIQSGDQISESPYLTTGGWWGKDINQWKELETDFVQVTNGEVKIAGHDNGFIAWTGFRLYYYGETPNFDGLLAPTLNQAVEDAAALAFAGDQKVANELLGKIPSHITTPDEYMTAQEDLKVATDYISKALAATGANWQAPNNFSNLAAAKEGDVAEFLMVAWDATGDLEVSPDAVYTDAIEFDNIYKAYESYVNFRESLGKYLEDDAVAAVITEQNAYLKAQVASVEKIDEFKNALGTPVNIARFKDEGADRATLNNPVDVSFLLNNPKFWEGAQKGWDMVKTDGNWVNDQLGTELVVKDGEETLYRTISEIWGSSQPFTISQTVNGLPAGTYEVRTHATFRDTWRPDNLAAYLEAEEAGDLAKYNLATLFAEGANGQNRQEEFVKSIYSTRLSQPSFTYYSEYGWYEYDSDDKVYYQNRIDYLTDYEDDVVDYVQAKGLDASIYDGRGVALNEIPFDYKNTVQAPDPEDTDFMIDVDYYYPQRTIGFVKAIEIDPENYYNKVYVNLPEGGTMTIGIDKAQSDGNSSLMMYDWEIFYCGTEIPTAIDAITEAGEAAAAEGAVEYYSVNGVKLSAPQKGFNIIKKGSTVKKVYIQ